MGLDSDSLSVGEFARSDSGDSVSERECEG